jgi:Family of unknown function (DUF5906)
MAEVNPLFAALQGRRAFIIYRLEVAADGSLDKVPKNPATGESCNPHDPAQWLTGDEAQAWAKYLAAPYGIGVVISEDITLADGRKLFCLDIDKCRDGNQWLPHAASFCARFPGAFIECSVSGNGLHVFATYVGERPTHGVKNKEYKIELYTRLRFIALGIGGGGDPTLDHTRAFTQLAESFFPPRDEIEYVDALTTAPVVEWVGPNDDDELLTRAMRSHSAGAVFGGKAAFADLFNANADILARVFPPFKNTAYDFSSADQALANHLAFWTGNHGERIERLMRRSALVRDKWERPEYLTRTINYACSSQKQWYKESKHAQPIVPPVPQTAQASTGTTPTADNITGGIIPSIIVPSGERPPIGDYLTIQQQLSLFAGCVYVQDVHQVMMPQGYMLSAERFDAEFSGYTFMMTADGQRPAKRAWEAFVHSEVYSFPKVKGTFFDPRQESRKIVRREGWQFINSWVPIEIKKTKGDASPFLNHILKLIPNGTDAGILLAYLAACVQYQGYKFQWWPLIQGVEGNGKTLISVLLQMAIGKRLTHWPKASELGSKFNAPFYGCVLICVEDVFTKESRDSLFETLKPMITGSDLEIESKGVDKVMREVCFNGVLNTNHKNGIRKTRNDRRICNFFCAQQHESDLERDGLTEEYFNEFRRWVYAEGGPIVAEFLSTYEIPDKWNPATKAIRAPKTTATEMAILAGFGSVEQEVLEAINQGQVGFRNGWVSSTALDRLLGVLGKAAAIPRTKRRELLETLGYSPHRMLPEGRSNTPDTDGSRPQLYVRSDAAGAGEADPTKVMQWYQQAQR